jgi:hypothetical protein
MLLETRFEFGFGRLLDHVRESLHDLVSA